MNVKLKLLNSIINIEHFMELNSHTDGIISIFYVSSGMKPSYRYVSGVWFVLIGTTTSVIALPSPD